MSDFSKATHKAFDNIEEWLENPKNSIALTDDDTQKPISWIVNHSRKQHFSADDISKKFNSIKALFEKLYEKEYKTIIVRFKASNGTSTKVVEKPFKIHLSKHPMLNKGGGDHGAFENLKGAPDHYQKQSVMNGNFMTEQFGGLGAAAQHMGLGVAEIVDLKTTKRLYDKLESDYKELKAKSEAAQIKHKNDYDRLEIEKRSLEVDLKTKEKEQELAIQKIEAAQKSFADTPLAKELGAGLKDIAQIFIASKTGAPQQLPDVGLSVSGVSEAKRQLLDYVVSNEVSEDTANFMSYVLYHLENTSQFQADLQVLIDKYQQ